LVEFTFIRNSIRFQRQTGCLDVPGSSSPIQPEKQKGARAKAGQKGSDRALLGEFEGVMSIVLLYGTIPYPLILDIRFSPAVPRKNRLD